MWRPEAKPSRGQLNRINASDPCTASRRCIASMEIAHVSHRWAGSMGGVQRTQPTDDHNESQSMGPTQQTEIRESSSRSASTDRSNESYQWIGSMNRTKGLDQAIEPAICISERHLWAESRDPITEPEPHECTEPLGLERVEWLPVEHSQTYKQRKITTNKLTINKI